MKYRYRGEFIRPVGATRRINSPLQAWCVRDRMNGRILNVMAVLFTLGSLMLQKWLIIDGSGFAMIESQNAGISALSKFNF